MRLFISFWGGGSVAKAPGNQFTDSDSASGEPLANEVHPKRKKWVSRTDMSAVFQFSKHPLTEFTGTSVKVFTSDRGDPSGNGYRWGGEGQVVDMGYMGKYKAYGGDVFAENK